MTELEQYIRSYFNINQEDLAKVNSLFKETTLKKDKYFVKEGGYCTRLAFIKSGLIRMYKSQEGKEITQWISTKGYFVVDLSSFIFQKPARWNIQALTDCELFTIDWQEYEKIGRLVPNWSELEKRFLTQCFTTLEERVFHQISMTAEERYHQFFETNAELFNQVPLQYIASMLGMTPETFSRIRAKRSS